MARDAAGTGRTGLRGSAQQLYPTAISSADPSVTDDLAPPTVTVIAAAAEKKEKHDDDQYQFHSVLQRQC
jgi:hypothetical protein